LSAFPNMSSDRLQCQAARPSDLSAADLSVDDLLRSIGLLQRGVNLPVRSLGPACRWPEEQPSIDLYAIQDATGAWSPRNGSRDLHKLPDTLAHKPIEIADGSRFFS